MTEVLLAVGGIVVRATVIYVALLFLLRIGGRRELAQLTPADMLLLLLLSEAVSPSLTAGHDSVQVGLLAAVVLVLLTWLIGWMTFRSPRFERVAEGNSLVLVRHGKVDVKLLRSLRITDRQLHTFLHEHGLIRMDQVAVAYVEPSGKVTIVKEDEVPLPRGAQPADDDEVAAISEIRGKLDELERRLVARRASRPGRSSRATTSGIHITRA